MRGGSELEGALLAAVEEGGLWPSGPRRSRMDEDNGEFNTQNPIKILKTYQILHSV